MYEEAGEVFDIFRGVFPISFLLFVPAVLIIVSPDPVEAAHEFSVYRMQQFDLQGTSYGCRNAIVNMEARSLGASMLTRRCVVTRLADLTVDKFKDLVDQSAGAVLVLLPNDLSTVPKESLEEFIELEHDLMDQDVNTPVYFAVEDNTLTKIYAAIQDGSNTDKAATATEALLHAASANGFQMVTTATQATPIKDAQITSIQGKLSGLGIEEHLPTVAIVAHYDTFGIAPHLSYGADSNGSGMVALLELARLFSKLYDNPKTHPKFNLLFLLSGGGKFNYQGTKRWIEDNLDHTDGSLLSEVSFVLCLDSVGSGDGLFLHVSKPPKEGSALHSFLEELKTVLEAQFSAVNFTMVHKKINLAEDLLAWEHERFSIRRLPAASLSHFPTHRAMERQSITDQKFQVDTGVLTRNIRVLAEALARHIYNLTAKGHDGSMEIFQDGLNLHPKSIEAWLNLVTSQPRAAQLIGKDHTLLSTMEQAMNGYLKDVRRLTFKPDKRDPEFVFYSAMQTTMNAYNVKPAVFDLFLAVGIAVYLGLVYVAIINFHFLYNFVTSINTIKVKVKHQ
ncbi:BOS complex subunit NCLN-like [Branchiostoma floridae x Branchiostoma belcheri]